MSLRGPLGWLVWLATVAGLIALALLMQPHGRPVRQSTDAVGFPLGPATPLDPAVIAPTDAKGAGSGTAFSVSDKGVWLTARHVVEGCDRIALVTGRGRGVAARARITPATETAVLYTDGGAPALSAASRFELRSGEIAYTPGFPKGRPGEVAARLLRRETLVLKHRTEPVLAWLEIGRTAFLWGGLAGLSGAPVIAPDGRVIAVTVAQAPRRHLLYTTTPAALAASLATAGARTGPASSRPIPPDGYHQAAVRLRGSLSVARVVCLG